MDWWKNLHFQNAKELICFGVQKLMTNIIYSSGEHSVLDETNNWLKTILTFEFQKDSKQEVIDWWSNIWKNFMYHRWKQTAFHCQSKLRAWEGIVSYIRPTLRCFSLTCYVSLFCPAGKTQQTMFLKQSQEIWMKISPRFLNAFIQRTNPLNRADSEVFYKDN